MMTEAEAMTLVAALKSGKRFATRFQEEEWGIMYEGNGRFQKWSHRVEPFEGGKEEWSHEQMSEAEVVALFMAYYSFDRMQAGLR